MLKQILPRLFSSQLCHLLSLPFLLLLLLSSQVCQISSMFNNNSKMRACGKNLMDELQEPLLEKNIRNCPPKPVKIIWEIDVIKPTDTTEQDDLAKALALSKRHFWRQMVTRPWACSLLYWKFDGNKAEILNEKCREWRRIAVSIDAYVNSSETTTTKTKRPRLPVKWKCVLEENNRFENIENNNNNNNNNGSTMATGSNNKNKNLANLVKKRTQLVQGELQLSSAMEVAKAFYRDMFIDEYYEDIIEMELPLETGLLFAPFWVERARSSNNAQRNIVGSFDAETELWNRLKNKYATFLDQLKHLKANRYEIELQSLRIVHDTYKQLWELGQENGLNMVSMCYFGTKFKAAFMMRNEKATSSNRHIMNSNNNSDAFTTLDMFMESEKGPIMGWLENVFSSDSDQMRMEERLGKLFWVYKYIMDDQQQHHHHHQQLQRLNMMMMVKDSCEEATLTVIEMDDNNNQNGD